MLYYVTLLTFLYVTSLAADESPRAQRQSGWYGPISNNWPFYDAQDEMYQLRSLPIRRPSVSYSPNAIQIDDVEGRLGFGLLNSALTNSRPIISLLNSLPVIRNPNFPTLQNLINSYDSCTATTGESGICTPGFACSAYGGRPSGSCGFGTVCCVNVVSSCSSQMTLNNTYWETPSTGINRPTSCSLTVKLDQRLLEQRKSPICQVRLDFVSFTIAQPEPTTQCSTDVFRVDGASNDVPEICGDEAGQHMYLTVPNSGTTATNLNLVFGFGRTGTVTPSWKIKVSLLPCGANYLAPDNCLQYITSPSGTVKAFNWGDETQMRQLANQNYRVCFRTELVNGNSAKSLCLTACSTTTAATGFSISGDATGTLASQVKANDCNTDYLIFPGGYNKDDTTKVSDRFCGTAFNADSSGTSVPVCSKLKPFSIVYVTDDNAGTDVENVGFCFDYQQYA